MLQNVEYVKADLLQDGSKSISDNLSDKKPVDSNSTEKLDVQKVNVSTMPTTENFYWLSDCLQDAQNAILEHHGEKPDDKTFTDCAKFFANKKFDIKIQNNGNASGDINLIRDLPSQPSYKIFVHDVFQADTRDNRRMVTIILVHHLLHALHPSRMHDSIPGQNGINKMEHDIANKSSYHDAVLNLESMHQSGKIHFCTL